CPQGESAEGTHEPEEAQEWDWEKRTRTRLGDLGDIFLKMNKVANDKSQTSQTFKGFAKITLRKELKKKKGTAMYKTGSRMERQLDPENLYPGFAPFILITGVHKKSPRLKSNSTYYHSNYRERSQGCTHSTRRFPVRGHRHGWDPELLWLWTFCRKNTKALGYQYFKRKKQNATVIPIYQKGTEKFTLFQSNPTPQQF
uniref:Uncharacterized protein n=1 Tax=Sus scrofa TaxID=9823 RepID=A0A8D0UL45_PIG